MPQIKLKKETKKKKVRKRKAEIAQKQIKT